MAVGSPDGLDPRSSDTAARYAVTHPVVLWLVASEPHHSFGHDLVGETWELPLG